MGLLKRLILIAGVSLIILGTIGMGVVFVWGSIKILVLAWCNVYEWAGWWAILIYICFLPLLFIVIPWYELMMHHNPYPLLIFFIYPIICLIVIVVGGSLQKLVRDERNIHEQ